MKPFLILILLISCTSHADIHIGLMTKHVNAKQELNENNNLIGYTYTRAGVTWSAASFKNSFDRQSFLMSVGRESRLTPSISYGLTLAVVSGYEGEYHTPVDDLMIAPVVYLKTGRFTHTIMGEAYNLSITIP